MHYFLEKLIMLILKTEKHPVAMKICIAQDFSVFFLTFEVMHYFLEKLILWWLKASCSNENMHCAGFFCIFTNIWVYMHYFLENLIMWWLKASCSNENMHCAGFFCIFMNIWVYALFLRKAYHVMTEKHPVAMQIWQERQ